MSISNSILSIFRYIKSSLTQYQGNHHSPLTSQLPQWYSAALSNWRPAGRIRPARRFYPALKVSLILSKFNRHSAIVIQLTISFYHAMHYSAKRGIAIACRPSVCPSVRLSVCLSVCLSVTLVDQDHIHWRSRKLIARTRSPTPSLFGAQRAPTYSEGNMGKFWGE